MRFRRIAIALPAALCLALTACASGGDAADGLTLYNDKGAWSPQFTDLGALSKRQIGLKMTPFGYSDEPTYQATIRSSFQTEARPDLFSWSTGPQLRDLAERGQLADTSDVWRRAIANGDLSPAIKQYYTVGGRQYCVPLANSYWGMFYNKKIFARYGLRPPRTWAELMSIAETLKSHGITPFYQTTVLFTFAWFQQLLAGSDPQLYQDLAAGKAKYTDPGVVAVLERYRELARRGYLADPGVRIDPVPQLKSGRVAMVPSGTFLNTTFVADGLEPGTDYDFFVIPNVNPRLPKTSVLYETGAMCIPANARKLGDSKRFAAWWLGESAQRAWSHDRAEVSTNPKVKAGSASLNELAANAESGKTRLLNRYYDITPTPILITALDALGAIMVNPGEYREHLEDIQQAADAYWALEK